MNAGSPEDKLKVLAYSILKLIKWSKEQSTHLSDITTFSQTKVKLIPYYMCSANGMETRKELFTFYDSFYARDFGYSESDVEDGLLKIPNIKFNKNQNYIEIESGIIEDNNYLDFFKGNNILTVTPPYMTIEGKNGSPNMEVNSVYDLIDHSIEVYKSNEWFFPEYEERALIKLCRKHSGWQVYNMIKDYKDKKIDTDILINEDSVYAQDVENRILI